MMHQSALRRLARIGCSPHFDEDGIGVDAGQDAHRDPAGLLDIDVEAHGAGLAVGDDFPVRDSLAVDDDFDRDLAGVSDAATLDVPIGFFVEAGFAHALGGLGGFGGEQGGGVEGDLDLAGFGEVELADLAAASGLAHRDVANLEIEDVAHAVAAVAAAVLDAVNPTVEVEWLVFIELHVNAGVSTAEMK